MRAATIFARVCLTASAMLLTACGKPPPASVFPSADDALNRMKATYACVNGVQGTAKIDRFAPECSYRCSARRNNYNILHF